MFKFLDYNIYSKARSFNLRIREYLKDSELDYPTMDQMRRASLSVVLNVAEGSGRFLEKDRRRFFIMSRSSIFECVALLDMVNQERRIEKVEFEELISYADELSIMLYSMIRKLSDSN